MPVAPAAAAATRCFEFHQAAALMAAACCCCTCWLCQRCRGPRWAAINSAQPLKHKSHGQGKNRCYRNGFVTSSHTMHITHPEGDGLAYLAVQCLTGIEISRANLTNCFAAAAAHIQCCCCCTQKNKRCAMSMADTMLMSETLKHCCGHALTGLIHTSGSRAFGMLQMDRI